MPIQWLDVILILVMLLSAFLAMRRGLTREMLLLMIWALSALVALFVYQLYRERMRALIGSPLLADVILISIVFIFMLIILGTLTPHITLPPPPPHPAGVLDRILGFVFGLVRGLLLVVIAYELILVWTPRESLPRWITEARSLPLIERTGRTMLSLLPDNPGSIFQSAEHAGEPCSDECLVALPARVAQFPVSRRESRTAIVANGWIAEGDG